MDALSVKIHIFLVQPLDAKRYKEMIVYADNEKQARAAAALVASHHLAELADGIAPDSIYLNNDMSICIEIEPTHLQVGSDLKTVQVEYEEVIYHLKKDVAQSVVVENFSE